MTIMKHSLRVLFALLVVVSVVNEIAGVSISSLTFRLRMLNLSPNPDLDSIWNPALSPLVRTWQIFKPTNLDLAWVRATAEDAQVDWLVVAAALGVIAFCAIMCARALRGERSARSALWIGVVVACAVVAFSLASYEANLPPGTAGYHALLNALARDERAGDVVILNDDAQARLWFDANRARSRWYGLSRDPARWDAPAQALVERLTRSFARVWFAYDDAVADAPNPMREWMEANLTRVQQRDFDGGVHLLLFQGR